MQSFLFVKGDNATHFKILSISRIFYFTCCLHVVQKSPDLLPVKTLKVCFFLALFEVIMIFSNFFFARVIGERRLLQLHFQGEYFWHRTVLIKS